MMSALSTKATSRNNLKSAKTLMSSNQDRTMSSRPMTAKSNFRHLLKTKSEPKITKIDLDTIDLEDHKYLSKNMKRFLELKNSRENRNNNIQS